MKSNKERMFYLFGAISLLGVLFYLIARGPKAEPIALPDDGKPVVIYFYSTTCSICKTVKPLLDKAVTLYADKVHILKVDIRNPHPSVQNLIASFGVQGVPEVHILAGADRTQVAAFQGLFAWNDFKNAIEKAIRRQR